MARLEARLHRTRLRRVRATAARAALEALCLQLFLLPLAGVLAAVYPFDPLGLQLALATYAVYLWVPLRLARARRRRRFAVREIAASLDRLNPEAPDIFRTVLSRDSHSEETRDALEAFYAPWENRLADLSSPVWTKGRALGLGAAAGFAVLLPFVAGRLPGVGGAGEVFTRMLLPLRAWNAIPAPRLTPVWLPEIVMRGDSLTVVVRADHVSPSRPVYVHRVEAAPGAPGEPANETRYLMQRDVQRNEEPHRAGFARHAFGPATVDFSLSFSTPGFATKRHRVRVAEPPRLASFAVAVQPPAYAGLPAERLPEMPALLSVLPGSRVTWTARAAAPLARLSADYAGKKIPVSGGGRDFSFGQRVAEAGELRMRLADARGAETPEGPFRIELKTDAPPEITLLAPAADQDLGRALKLPVLFRARDDYGLARVWLRYAVLRGGRDGSPRPGSVEVTRWLNVRDGAGGGVWDAGGLGLEAGDAVELWLEAFDNDAVSGPKSSLSARVKLRLPSREEARAAVEAGERDAAVSLASALEREKRLRREEARPHKGASAETGAGPVPQAVPEWEVRRVLSDQPRQHLQEVKRQLDEEVRAAEKEVQEAKAAGEASKAPRAEQSLKALRELRKEAEGLEKRLPPPAIGQAPLEQQKRALETLNADQKNLQRKLREKKAEEALAGNRRHVEESLARNLQEQKDMKAWLEEQERNAATERKRAQQAAQNAAQMEQDMKRALEQIDQAMEKGLENGTLSPEILDKMERIRELLEEVLDEDEKESLRRAGQDERVEAGDLQKAMRDLLDKKEGLRQNLESAIRMLEALRETRALRDAAAEARELAEAQKELAAEIGRPDKEGGAKENAAALAARQEDLNRRMDATLKGLESLSKNPSLKDALKDLDKQNPREARANMQKAADKLKAPAPDRKASKQGADLASKQLKQMAAEMEKKVAQLDKAANAAETRAMLEETLDFSAWLEAAGDPRGPTARSWGGEEGVRQGAVRLARWLRGRLEKLADADPFNGDVLRREAASLGFTADALATAQGAAARGGLEDLRAHALKAARELFKMLDKNEEGNGDQEGDGAGNSDAGGGDQGESGQEGVSGRMKGAAGKQDAVNRATQELLRSFLEGRQGNRPGSGQSPGGKSPGGQGSGGSKPQPGRDGLPGNTAGHEAGGEGEGEGGGQAEGGSSEGGNSGNANGLANAQQQVGESLEQLAEAAGDAGGASRKLRQLAEEARDLEEALRRRSLSPAEIQRRQERFRTRLLEAAHALEERGEERERRAEAYKGGALPPSAAAAASFDENWTRELKRRRDEARKLPLPPEQKRRVEWYYEQLLAP
jgi:hypothetical protein